MRNAWSIDVGIKQPHATARPRQSQRNASSNGAFANTPLTRANGNHALGLQTNLTKLGRRSNVLDNLDVHDRHLRESRA